MFSNALSETISKHIPLPATRRERLAWLALLIMRQGTICLWRLAAHVATAATTTTGSVRFHRFFQHVALDGSKTARVVADLLGMRGKPWVVTGAKVWVTAHFFLASIRRDGFLCVICRRLPPFPR